ncbi:SusD/RagB family nutrient-binding outer membrane lipoprotein [Mucilaginibacter sp. SMC90]|uniref:SusD/RagB family nutrient-binding outer membrane lipoprotein n=1 Tax=Mucilaginibacter sp. SMC90 TaxID=2929803 RepID=UPI001FB24FB0|nr:SusD/RagB family nutrient-binding outer membrane lipoprotein [Mucilaginibacter sp. SMC90]UOE49673.1 SusD/RagB family nutrient-binding outer membrane lipoprotein [Mucilaginibacter sp. SMC90]
MKKLIGVFFAATLIVSSSCKKSFFDINTNPNSPTDAAITPAALLPQLLHRVAAKVSTSYNPEGDWMGYWARSGSYGPSTEEESYNITTTFEADEWSSGAPNTGWFDILADANTMEKKATASKQTFYVGIAKIIKSIGYMYLVDEYNNVPYSKAFDIVGNITPAYDKGADIYKDLLLQLDDAAKLIKASSADANPGLTQADITFHGDPTLWRKLANSQRLRLLIHESEVLTNASAEVAKITADGAGFLGDGGVDKNGSATDESAYVNPPYVQEDGRQNPFWDTFKNLYTGSAANQYYRANNYLLEDVYAWSSSSSYDTRFLYVFAEAATPLNGNVYYGYNYGELLPGTAPKAVNSSDVSGPGLAISPSQPQWFFTSVESLFLKAEAIQRGWLTGVTAESAYDVAVKASFKWLGAPDSEAADYLANDPKANFSGASSKISQIAFQKYIALAGINNFEAWVDYRRLDGADAILKGGNQPVLPLSLSPSRGSRTIPLRLMYPQNEYNFNAANVAKEGTINPQTSRIFWDKGAR